VEVLECHNLKNEINQLALLLYPPDLLNEKFLIKIRDCVFKLAESHPLKKWLRWISQGRKVDEKFKDDYTFLVEVVNSPFNLITDGRIKKRISEYLIGMVEDTLPEKFLKSYLYLMIGNVTRSDNLLKKIITTAPRINWKNKHGESLEHRIGKELIKQIFLKFSRHPADRKIFKLVVLYLQSYYNDQGILEVSDGVDTKDLETKLFLKTTEILAPELVKFLKLSSMKEAKRAAELRTLPSSHQSDAYWIWPFLETDKISTSDYVNTLKEIEEEDSIWYIYTISDERVSETLAKQSINHFLPGYRGVLKTMLDDSDDFMLALFKLVELGDINSEMVQKTIKQMINE
jgi:hypothetical protein